MTEMQRLPGPNLPKLARRSLISALVGIAIVFLSTFGVAGPLRIRLVGYGALGGFFIAISCSLLGRVYGRWIRGVPSRYQRLMLAGVYFVGGILGFVVAMFVSVITGLLPWPVVRQIVPYSGLISGAVAVVVGLLFYTFGILQDRLSDSVAKLKEHEFAEKELELARSIQKRLLPPSEIETEGYRLSARNVPARLVAGDFYDVFDLGGGALGIAVGDVSGKGMGASLIMASVKAVLPLVAARRSVDDTMAELNRKLVAELGPREFVALAYLRCEADGRFTLANAGLPDPYLVGRGAPPRALEVPGARFPLGSRRDVEYRALEGRLEREEMILLFTDGLPEAPTAAGEPIGYPALERLIARDSQPASAFLDGLLERLRAATGPALEDDWTAVAVERTR
jgi:hypothetical protein